MKPKIEDIKFDAEELNKIKQKLNTNDQQWLMRSLIGGVCVKCQEVPTKNVSY